MMEEEGMVIVGLLVGLNVLDANLCLKGEDLDSQVTWDLGFNGMNGARNFLHEILRHELNLRKEQKARGLWWRSGQTAVLGEGWKLLGMSQKSEVVAWTEPGVWLSW